MHYVCNVSSSTPFVSSGLSTSAPSVSSEPAAPPAEPTAKWRDAPSVPGLPSMDRVWGVLSAMRPAASRRGSIKADAASAQPQSAQPRRAARVAAPLSSADVPSAAEAGDKAAGAGQGAEFGEEANDPTPLTPSVTSTSNKHQPQHPSVTRSLARKVQAMELGKTKSSLGKRKVQSNDQ